MQLEINSLTNSKVMCKVSKEAILRANRKTTQIVGRRSEVVSVESMTVSVRYHGNTYSREVTMVEAKKSFGRAMSIYGKKL